MNNKVTNEIVDNNMTTKSAAPNQSQLTLADARNQLVQLTGKRYWRSIDELSGSPEFEAAVAREFPDAASEWVDPVSRRGFMKLMGASLALAGMAGCTKQPDEPIFAYVKQPEDLVLGKSNFFATAAPFTTGAVPVLVKSDQFRPIKVDGNPEHPYNQGGSDPFTQATLLELYDPDRAQYVTRRGEKSTWADFELALRSKAQSSVTGEGIYFLSTTITSPTLARQWADAQKAYPKAKLIQYDPATAGSFVEKGINTQFDLSAADVILSLDADFLSGSSYPGFHRLLRDYAERRKNPEKLNRLYAVESATTTTGMKAEHRLGARASFIPVIAAAIAKASASPVSMPRAYPLPPSSKIRRHRCQRPQGQRRQIRSSSRPLSGFVSRSHRRCHQQAARQLRQNSLHHIRDRQPAAQRSARRPRSLSPLTSPPAKSIGSSASTPIPSTPRRLNSTSPRWYTRRARSSISASTLTRPAP